MSDLNPYDLPESEPSHRRWLRAPNWVVLGVAVAGGYAALVSGALTPRVLTDPTTGCRRDERLAHTTMVIVDQTVGFRRRTWPGS